MLLAFTNRFLALSALIRELHSRYKNNPSDIILGQIANLRKRVTLIRSMQAIGVSSLLLCVLCMFLLFAELVILAKYFFGLSLILLMISLALSVWEIQISVHALNLQLSDIEHKNE